MNDLMKIANVKISSLEADNRRLEHNLELTTGRVDELRAEIDKYEEIVPVLYETVNVLRGALIAAGISEGVVDYLIEQAQKNNA